MAEFIVKDLVQKANLEKEFFISGAGTSGEYDEEGMHYGTKNKLTQLNIEHKKLHKQKTHSKALQ